MLSLTELKKLHDKGLALIYLRPKSKRPFEKKWTTNKPKSWAELEVSFEKSYNVGVRLGQPSRLPNGNYLGAIDCDVKSKSRKAIQEMNEALRGLGLDLSLCPIVTSGRGNGSKHIYVQTTSPMKPGKFASSKEKVKVSMPGETREPTEKERKLLTAEEIKQGFRIRSAWEISFMGQGQQTVLPPSIHPDTGFQYAWASPLSAKYCPLFKPEKFLTGKPSSLAQDSQTGKSAFQACQVDLWGSKLGLPMVRLIVEGQGCENRSDSLLPAAMSMCRAGFTDNEILSVLTDSNNYLASAGLERKGGNRLVAAEWVRKYTLAKARYETDVMRYFDNPPTREERKPLTEKKAEKVATLIESDKNLVLPDHSKEGNPKPTLRNVVHALTHFLGGALVGYDAFANRPVFLKDTPYGGVKGKELTDDDDLRLSHYLACHYRFEPSTDICYKAHTLIGKQNSFHPVTAYIESIRWDGIPRIDGWLREAFGARGPDTYLSAISRKVLVAAVKRVYEPGCKFDYVLVLEGFQGKGKSMALSTLAGREWFTDSLGDIHNKDVVDQMTGKWITELAELSSIKKADIDSVKAFLSRQVDRVRPPYGRRSMDFPRQGVFIGSTNNSEFLHDETGNRRIWPVRIQQANRKWLKANRDQLWAEAKMRYDLGETTYLNDALETVAAKEQEKRFVVDEWEHEIKKVVKEEKGPFLTTELWRSINMDKGSGHPPMAETMRIGRIMRRLGFIKKVRKMDKQDAKCWVKP